jgi:hypothetical protein
MKLDNRNAVVAQMPERDTTPLGLNSPRPETQGSSFLATRG